MENQPASGGLPNTQSYRQFSAGHSSAAGDAGAAAGASPPSRLSSAGTASNAFNAAAAPLHSGTGAAPSLTKPSSSSFSTSASSSGGRFEAPDGKRAHQGHPQKQHHYHQHSYQQQQPQHQSPGQRQHPQQMYQQEQAPTGEAPLDRRGESMKGVQAATSQQQQQPPRPPATPEEKLRIREKYTQRMQERNVQIYQDALEEVLRKERQEAVRRALFKINCPTRFGQNVYLVGSHAALGEWAVDRAVSMTWGPGNIWTVELQLPRDANAFEYKYIIKEGPHVIWEPGKNHALTAERYQKTAAAAAKANKHASAGGSMCVMEDAWGVGEA